MRKRASLAALLLSLASIAEAQIPRCRTAGCRKPTTPASGAIRFLGTMETRNQLTTGGFWHLVTVDSGGAGDYTDLGDALAFVAAQTPTVGNQWMVLVYMGSNDPAGFSYSETAITIPDFTVVTGISASATIPANALLSRPAVNITGTTGTGVTLGSFSSIVDMGIQLSGLASAGFVGVGSASGISAVKGSIITVAAAVTDVQYDVVKASGGTIYLERCMLQRLGNSKTATRHVVASSGAVVLAESWMLPSSSQAVVVETSGGTVRLVGGRIQANATLDLKNTSGTLSVDNLAYSTESGTITRAGILTPRHTSGATLPAACVVPETFTDTTAGAQRQCFCSAANTWTCNAGALTAASPPFACDAGHAGALYVDTTTPSLCFCVGSAWTTTVALGDCS